MTQQIAAVQKSGQVAEIDEGQLVNVLRNSLYPGASENSIFLVLDYCRAARLDPMLKPVHIVPMWNKAAGKMVDVIMPGINLYRIQASRSGQFAGMSEPEFGPMITATLSGVEITYPEWARVTVERLMPSGHIAKFPAIEYWTENYATGGRDTEAPNAMWKKRPRGQIAKCASAQALRMAFPEIASAPTAEEMEGKIIETADDQRTVVATVVKAELAEKPAYTQAQMDANLPSWKVMVETGVKTPERIIAFVEVRAKLSPEQIEAIKALAVKPAEEKAGDAASAETVQPATDKNADAKPEMTQQAFAAGLPVWTDQIATGKKTAKQLIAMLETKNVLTLEQHATLSEIEVNAA